MESEESLEEKRLSRWAIMGHCNLALYVGYGSVERSFQGPDWHCEDILPSRWHKRGAREILPQ